MKSYQEVFIKPSTDILTYCYRKNLLNLGIESTQSGQIVAVFDFHCHILYILFILVDIGWVWACILHAV